jgi:hypothetical protein
MRRALITSRAVLAAPKGDEIGVAAHPRIFRENTKQEAIADSYDLIRVTEVAYEFNTRR